MWFHLQYLRTSVLDGVKKCSALLQSFEKPESPSISEIFFLTMTGAIVVVSIALLVYEVVTRL